MRNISRASYSRVYGTSDERSPLHLYRPDGSVHYIKQEGPALSESDSSRALPTREIDFEQLPDGRLAEMVEDPDDPKRSLLAVGRDDSYQLVESIKCGKEILVPLPRQGEFLRFVTLTRGVEGVRGRTRPGIAPPEALFFLVFGFIQERVAVHPTHAAILTFFAISTWFVDRFDVAPYLLIVGPPESGKTTLLSVLALFCRRPLLVGDISSAALYRATSRIHPTLLVDESTTQVGQSDRALRHLLRVGTTRQGVARAEEMFDCYGAKVIVAPEPPHDAALNSRSIIVPMLKANPEKKDLGEPEVQRYVEALRQGLLRWRLNQWASIQPARVPGSESLAPRAQDLLSCLAAAAPTQEGRDFLLEYFKRSSPNIDEDRSTVLSRLVNSVLHRLIHGRTEGDINDPRLSSWVMVKAITDTVNRELRLRGERFQLKPENVGHILTALGLTNRGRTNCGVTLWLDLTTRRRIHLNARNYGQEELALYYGPQLEGCPLCKENSLDYLLGKVPPAPEQEPEQSSDAAQNSNPVVSPGLKEPDKIERAAKTLRKKGGTQSVEPSRSKRRGVAKR